MGGKQIGNGVEGCFFKEMPLRAGLPTVPEKKRNKKFSKRLPWLTTDLFIEPTSRGHIVSEVRKD